MHKRDYQLWIDYHSGDIHRELTRNEYSEIAACDFAMHLLIPTDSLLEICGGWENLEKMNFYHDHTIVERLSDIFLVPEEVVFFKLDYLIKMKRKEKQDHSPQKRILKKEGNIVFVQFD